MKVDSISNEMVDPLNSKDEKYHNQMYGLLNESFPSQSSDDHSGVTAALIKQFDSRMKLKQQASSDSFQHESRLSEDCTDAGTGMSRDSCDTGYSHDNESVKTDWLGIPEHLQKDWKDVIPENIVTLYETAAEAVEYVINDISNVTKGILQKITNDFEVNVDRSLNHVDVQDSSVTKQIETHNDIPLTENQKTYSTREEYRMQFKAKLASMDSETAQKFKLMLMKQKLQREKKSAQHNDE